MFKPARMTRLLVGGHQEHMEAVIRTLHAQGAIHLEDYRDPTDLTGIGTPLEAGDEVSDLLLRARGLQRALDCEGWKGKDLPTDDAAKLMADAEAAAQEHLPKLGELRNRRAAVDSEAAQLDPLRGLDVDLAAVRKVSAVRVFLGLVREDPTEALRKAGIEHELSVERGPHGLTVLLMVRPDDANPAERALVDAGFTAASVPPVDGTPSQALTALHRESIELDTEIAKLETQVEGVRQRWGGRLATLEAHLAAEAQKTAAPLRFGVTANTFHLEGWVPVKRLNHIHNVLAAEFGESLYIEDLGDVPMEGKDPHHVEPEDEAPTQLVNKGPAGKFEFLLGLLALPRYKEIDPTKLMAFFFPIFFGLMVGDVIIGLLILLFGLFLRNHAVFGIGGQGVAKPIMWGGFLSMIVGALIFGEGLGLHFVISEEAEMDGEHSWETAFGFEFPDEGFLHTVETGHQDAGHAMEADHSNEANGTLDHGAAAGEAGTEATGGTLETHAEETSPVLGLLEPHGGTFLSAGPVQLGHYSKIHDIEALLIWSILIGFTHIVLGLLIGIRNVAVGHGIKLAVQEKLSWLGILGAVILMAVGSVGGASGMLYGGIGLLVVSIALLWMGVQHTIGVGFVSILEVPGIFGNILSYTRLAAIGASKAGMAIAFATIGFELIGGVAGIVIYLVAALLITVLAILAGFLQSLRLQFVEFFSKFFEGGGRAYQPFGRP